MQKSIYEIADTCCNEFQQLLLEDKYINKKRFEKFLDKYKTVFNNFDKIDFEYEELLKRKLISIMNNGYKIITSRNKKYINRKLVTEKDYFDNMFKDLDENILLDEEQRKAILIDEDYSLVIAGAGSGKTTTMAAKVKYLIEKCHISPQKIILLSFTNKATEELDQRINNEFKLNVPIKTFHKLGMDFIRKLFNNSVSIVAEGTMYNYIKDYVTTKIFPDKNALKHLINTFDEYVSFDENVLNFNNFDDYFEYYANKTYVEHQDNLDEYIEKIVKQRIKHYKTIEGDTLKSQSEVKVANYLYKNGLNYTYEKMYPHRMANGHAYVPDFTIEQDGLVSYIEYYGMTKVINNKFTTYDTIMYNNLIEKKRELHKLYKTDLIELYYEYDDHKKAIDILDEELDKRGFIKKERSSKEIFYKLLYTSKERQFFKFINLAINFINKFKGNGYNNEIFNKLINETEDGKLKEQLKILQHIYQFYNTSIHNNKQIDFNDMINYSYLGLDIIKEKNQNLTYDYIIIDEYQDISEIRYNFIKKLSDLFKAKIVAVGDDWQAIYRFSGSDMNLFTNFYNLMGYAEISKITKTYRNSQELIDIAGNFVSKNSNQFTKKLISDKHIQNPVIITYYDSKDKLSKTKVLAQTIISLFKENQNQKILLLGRYENDIDEFTNTNYFKKGPHDKIICKYCINADIEFLTIHKSKGLGYDNVILLNALSGKFGFPSEIKDNELIGLLNNQTNENIEFAEERRLFYVALTRTKGKIYILTPLTPIDKRSDFVNEIIEFDNVLEENNF